MTDKGTTEGAPGWVGDADDLLEVLRLAADPITVQDASGRLVYANEAAAHQIGFESAEALLAAPIETIVARYTLIDESRAPLAVLIPTVIPVPDNPEFNCETISLPVRPLVSP